MKQYNFPRPVYTKDLKDVPERLLRHEWLRTIDFNKLPKYQFKVRMCCPKCEEKVLEEIWEVHGVVDVITYRADKKVVVTGMPERPEAGFDSIYRGPDGFLDIDKVLRKARKIDCKARFVTLVPVVVPKPDDQKSGSDPKPKQPKSCGKPPKSCEKPRKSCEKPPPVPECAPKCHVPPYCHGGFQSWPTSNLPPCPPPPSDGATSCYFILLLLLVLILFFRF